MRGDKHSSLLKNKLLSTRRTGMHRIQGKGMKMVPNPAGGGPGHPAGAGLDGHWRHLPVSFPL